MKLRSFFCAFLFCSMFSFFSVNPGRSQGLDGTEIMENYRQATISIGVHFLDENNKPDCEHGSGAIVSSSGHVITAHHLFIDENGERYGDRLIKIRGVVGAPYDCTDPLGDVKAVQFIRQQHDVDAALVRIKAEGPFDSIVICRSTETLPAEEVAILGYPLAQELSFTGGEIKNKFGPEGLVSLSLELNDGDSGGPVFNVFGRFIGIAKGDIEEADDLSFMVPVELFRDLIDDHAPIVDCKTSRGEEETTGSCDPQIDTLEIEWVNDKHKTFDSSSIKRNTSIGATDGYFFSSFKWIPKSVNNASGLDISFDEDRKVIKVSAILRAGPSFDRWRGWVKGDLVTTQLRLECRDSANTPRHDGR